MGDALHIPLALVFFVLRLRFGQSPLTTLQFSIRIFVSFE